MALGTDALLTTMRPLVVELERALQAAMHAGLEVPTKPAPRIEAAADGSGRQWVEAEIDRPDRAERSEPRSGALYGDAKRSYTPAPSTTFGRYVVLSTARPFNVSTFERQPHRSRSSAASACRI